MRDGRRWHTLLENVLANYAYVGLMAVVTIFLTPIYVRTLGPSEWGVVALCLTVQAVLFLLDAGLGQVAPREFASVANDRLAQWRLYLRFKGLYARLALLAMLLGQLAVGPLLSSSELAGVASAEWALRLVLVQFALTFANLGPLGLWNGLQQQRLANVRQASFLMAKHGAALLLLLSWKAEAWVYVLPFVVVGLLEVWLNMRRVRLAYADVRVPETTPTPMTGLLSRVGGFGLAVLLGMATTHADRVLMASMLPVSSFGMYAVVVTFGLAFMNLQQPLQKAFLPRVVAHGGAAASTLFWATLVLCALPCLLVAWQSQWVLELWLGPDKVSAELALVLSWVLVGIALNGMYAADYTRMVAANAWRVVLCINLLILVAQVIVLWWATPRWGVVAGGWSWALCGAVQFVGGRCWSWRRGDGR